jgi:hypothetical protein
MIVWGGSDGAYLNTGGRYDPSTNVWTPTSAAAGVPEVRYGHTAVWSGTEMIVWGGFYYDGTVHNLNTGARYDPATDGWVATSIGADVPDGRQNHTAVWTGTEMIVWGGASYGSGFDTMNTGGRYDPSTNAWAATSTGANVPWWRMNHTAVWTGAEMIVWGGSDGWNQLNIGSRYDPFTDTWTPVSHGPSAPVARDMHTAVWTGTEMVVWGGYPYTSTGGRYCACPSGRIVYRDADGDGHGDPAISSPSCDGSIPPGHAGNADDCDDTDAEVHPGVAEICDSQDNDCNALIDDGISAPEGHPVLEAEASGDMLLLSWPLDDDATGYDVVKGSLGSLRSSEGDFTASTIGCLANDLPEASTSDDAEVLPDEGFWYLVRPVNCGGVGTFDGDTPGQVDSRDDEIAASGLSCP